MWAASLPGVEAARCGHFNEPCEFPVSTTPILAQVQAATAGKKFDGLERLSPGHGFFCTDVPFSWVLCHRLEAHG